MLGEQYVLQSDRLMGVESLLRNGDLSVRDLVRSFAKSDLYRSHFFTTCNAYRLIKLNHKHLLGRAPQSKEVMLAHFTLLQEQGRAGEIDCFIDIADDQERLGTDRVPWLNGWSCSVGQRGLRLSWLTQLDRVWRPRPRGMEICAAPGLGRALHQKQALPVWAAWAGC